ncbi:hypothetical protein WOSG25_110180 [Weissella oryzae SG25]|uniref:Uncharacterized protein n=1 Tax=Weissella oryzae (strain DSM 25784 / JCM 18191 / LMG 30913 / SG25) TaxID=1329250 RepID=A0A069CUQ7_WEIOS|nr:hypothetical protein [Weissella oryzae]GAK31540.1 hypothetical protein WOSG25_110180 [Weissella oryzae SG25]
MKFSIAKISRVKGLVQTVTGFGLMAMTQLITSGVADASLEDSAKKAGTDATTLISIIALVIGVVSLAIGWAYHATGSREGIDKGKKRIMYAAFSIGGVLLTGVLVTWVYNLFSNAGGGIGVTYPF